MTLSLHKTHDKHNNYDYLLLCPKLPWTLGAGSAMLEQWRAPSSFRSVHQTPGAPGYHSENYITQNTQWTIESCNQKVIKLFKQWLRNPSQCPSYNSLLDQMKSFSISNITLYLVTVQIRAVLQWRVSRIIAHTKNNQQGMRIGGTPFMIRWYSQKRIQILQTTQSPQSC